MDRYKFTKLNKNNNTYNNTYLPTTLDMLNSNIPIKYNTIITKSGDTLMKLAHNYYKDITLWWIIARFNKLDGNSAMIEPGILLKIPINYDEIINNLKKKN